MAKSSGVGSLEQYTAVAETAASEVIAAYSTSFGWATAMLDKSIRQSIKNIYALVRIADEIVDGAAAEAADRYPNSDLGPSFYLSELELEVYRTLKGGYSTNLVVHAFGKTAIEVGIDEDLIRPFFASMRTDLVKVEHSKESFERYVYGSAEVVGLMCLRVFTHNHVFTPDQLDLLHRGARALGSAFQKINFLRDLGADFQKLGRSYFPGVNVKSFSEEQKYTLIADIERELAISSEAMPLLPKSSRQAVLSAQMMFEELARMISATPASDLLQTRVSVPNLTKLRILRQAKAAAR
jgi:phytoene/squalene synthetase